MNLKRLLYAGLVLLISACNQNPPDPAGEPFKIELRAAQSAASNQLVDLSALVAYGPIGGVPSTIDFLNGDQVLATTTEGKPYTPTGFEVYDLSFPKAVTLQPNTDYNLSAKVTWTSKGVKKSLTSDVVKFRLANP